MWNPYDFTGKKIIVAGSTSGIGKATAVALARQGAAVFLVGRNEEKLQSVLKELEGNGHRYFVRDFKEAGNYQPMFEDMVSDGRKIDGMVYSAGIAKILPINVLNKKYLDESMTVNLYSFVEMVSLLSKKKYHNRASVVGVSSISVQYPQKCQGVYVATKAGMNAMVQSLAIELAEKEIRINTVMPAATDTAMMDETIAIITKEQHEERMKKQVLGLSKPEDIADIILFLLSDASRMITGRYLYADGGLINQ